jgi:rhamnogalacturonan endolyase
VRQLLGEDVNLNGGAVITNDLLVPGTPEVKVVGNSTIGSTIDGSGSDQPSNYKVTLNGKAQVGRLVQRTDAVAMPSVAGPPASTATRDVSINNSSQTPGDFSTLRDLTLNGNVGMYEVPAGTYRSFTANGGSGFILGIAGATEAAIYNFASLTLNGQSDVQVVGPVVVTIGGALALNASMGSSSNPLWLTLRIAAGGVTLNGGSFLSGVCSRAFRLCDDRGQQHVEGNLLLRPAHHQRRRIASSVRRQRPAGSGIRLPVSERGD